MANGADAMVGGMTSQAAFPDIETAKLVDALSHKDIATADAALRAGANVNLVGADEIAPLLFVMALDLREHTLVRSQYLLDHGANPNYRAKGQVSAMGYGVEGKLTDLLELLLNHGGDPNLIGAMGMPLLQRAVMAQNKEHIDILLKHGADINGTDLGHVDTAANVAISVGRFDLAVYLVEHGLKPSNNLALAIRSRILSPESNQQVWRDKLIDILKQHDIDINAPATRRKVAGSDHS